METYSIQGMTCEHCTRAVARALAGVPHVTRVIGVDLARGEAKLEGSPDEAAVIAAVREEGYEARRVYDGGDPQTPAAGAVTGGGSAS